MSGSWAIGIGMAIGVLACAPDLRDRLPRTKTRAELKLDPPAVDSVASRRVNVTSSLQDKPRLFALALSDSQLQSVRRGEPSQTVLEHEVTLSEVPRDEEHAGTEATTWQANGLLVAGTSYTVVAETAHLKFKTASVEPALVRVWPRRATLNRAVYCAESSVNLAPLGAHPEQLWGDDRVWFGPSDAGMGANDAGSLEQDSAWQTLAAEVPCFFWQSVDGASPPTHWHGFAVESFVSGDDDDTSVSSTSGVNDEDGSQAGCLAHETVIEHACVAVQDDRIIVRPTIADTLWLFAGDAQGWFVSGQREPGVIRGLVPLAESRLEVSVFGANGAVKSELVVNTLATERHVVINEVFPDPLGSEPQGEWVELYNDGASIVDLAGWVLEDDGGKVELPALQLAPFGYALLVNDTYARTSELDVVPDEDVFLIRLPSLGKSGLSNQGEALRLLDNSGKVVSSFPANPKPHAGVSVARREPWFVGAQARAFGLHSAPFASPGKRNSLGIE